MKLYIDTSSNQQTIVRLGEKELKQDSSVWRSQAVLPMIKKLLAAEGKKLSELSEIEVFTGPGSYTGLKVGVAIANGLGLVLKIPVNGKIISGTSIVEPVYSSHLTPQ